MDSKKIKIPLTCPICYNKLEVVKYGSFLKILKERSWHICTKCNFERSVEDFKNNLLVQ